MSIKCHFPAGIVVKPDGKHVDIVWKRQEDTIELDPDDEEEDD